MAFVYGCWCVCLSVCTLSLTHSSAGECNKCFVCPYCLFCSFDWPAEKWAAEGRRLLLEREREREQQAASRNLFCQPASQLGEPGELGLAAWRRQVGLEVRGLRKTQKNETCNFPSETKEVPRCWLRERESTRLGQRLARARPPQLLSCAMVPLVNLGKQPPESLFPSLGGRLASRALALLKNGFCKLNADLQRQQLATSPLLRMPYFPFALRRCLFASCRHSTPSEHISHKRHSNLQALLERQHSRRARISDSTAPFSHLI